MGVPLLRPTHALRSPGCFTQRALQDQILNSIPCVWFERFEKLVSKEILFPFYAKWHWLTPHMFTSAGVNANPDILCVTGSPQPGTESKAKHSMMLEKTLGLFAPVFPSIEERLCWRRDFTLLTQTHPRPINKTPQNKTKTKKENHSKAMSKRETKALAGHNQALQYCKPES